MSYRTIAVAPLVLALLALALSAIAPLEARGAIVQGEVDASKLIGLLGVGAAALAFARGDYLRRGWGALAIHYAFLLARDATLPLRGALSPLLYTALRSSIVTAANASMLFGVWTLARAWHAAGLDLPGPRWSRRAAFAAGFVVSLVLAGPIFVTDLGDLVHGRGIPFEMIPSDLGDIFGLPLVAPVALTALAVREGTLRWTWTLLASSLLAWLFYDAVYIVPDYFGLDAPPFHYASEQFHILAVLFSGAAGLAQRKAVTEDDVAHAA